MSSKPALPPWQRPAASAPSTPSPEHSPTTPETSTEESSSDEPAVPDTEKPIEDASSEKSPNNSSLLDQASRFLEDPAIRDAPQDRKVAFLQAKGVRLEEIEKLLGKEIPQNAAPDITQAGERAWSTAPPKSSGPPAPAPAPPPQPRDIPPIVTYPEFLAQPTQPPPLITTKRLLNTAYITGGIMATMYGLSKYIVAPMTQNLSESRHEFASHTQEKLEELNTRLKEAASVDPATTRKSKSTDAADDDVSEADSDPTELYHRDYGTQTSPSLSRRPSLASGADENATITGHENRLKILTSHLRELESTRSNDKASSSSLKTKLSDLTTYLGEMSYQNQYYHGMGGLYGGNYGLPKMKDGKEDQIEVLKNDIRAVKGVFLSARNFPAGGRSPIPAGRVGT